jgi:hypothetical protein
MSIETQHLRTGPTIARSAFVRSGLTATLANVMSPLGHSATWNSDTALLILDFQVIGSDVDLTRVPLGVGVRAGTPRPDISTVNAFKQTLLTGRSRMVVPKTDALRFEWHIEGL